VQYDVFLMKPKICTYKVCTHKHTIHTNIYVCVYI